MNIELRNKIALNKDNGKIVLVQVGTSFYKLKLERQITDIKELSGILDNNDVYLLKKGD